MSITIREKDKGLQVIVSYKLDGEWKQTAKQGFQSHAQAMAWGEQTEFEIKMDRYENIDPSKMTIGFIREEFLEHTLREDVAENTYLTYKNTLKILDPIQHWVASKVVPHEMRKFFFKLREEKGFSYHQHYSNTRIMFNFAMKEMRAIRYNPCSKNLQNIHIDDREEYIDKELYQKIYDSLTDPHEKAFVKLLHETGLRKSEAVGITIKDIQKDMVDINKQYNRGKFKPPKSKHGYRQLPISKSLVKDLMALPVKMDGRLFSPMTYLDEKLKIFSVSPHTFRYSFGTDLLDMGMNLKAAAELMGDSLEMYIRKYVKKNKKVTNKAIDILRDSRL